MNYKVKKKIVDFLMFPFFIISGKLGHYIRGILIMDLRAKIRAIKSEFPGFSYWRAKLMSGGANFCFLVDSKYVVKIKKNYTNKTAAEVLREKEMTDAARAAITDIKIPRIEVFTKQGFTFCKYDLISGTNLNKIPLEKINTNKKRLGAQLGNFICALHNARISHNDLSNNILVNPETLDLAGVIDWEFATKLEDRNETHDFFQFARKNDNKMKQSNLIIPIMAAYYERKYKNE